MNSVMYLRISHSFRDLLLARPRRTAGRAVASDSENARSTSNQRFRATPNSSINTKDPAQLLDVTNRLNVVHHHVDSAILIDDQRRPDWPRDGPAVNGLLSPGPLGSMDVTAGIGEERERQCLPLLELHITTRAPAWSKPLARA